MEIKTETVKIPAHDGGAFKAYVARPSEKGSYPAMIVIQEIFGINGDMRTKCEEFARKGYIAICPDLFWRLEEGVELVDSNPEELQKAFDLFDKFDEVKGVYDLKTTLGYVRHLKGCDKKVGAVGYCLGGKLAYMLACHSDVDATVSYYGVAINTLLDDAAGLSTPIILHIAAEDEYVDKHAQEDIIEEFENNTLVTLYVYEGAQHAFARKDGMHFDAEAATEANARTDAFFEKHLLS